MNNEILEARNKRGALATGQQRRASDPCRSVWVEASAGTGKTKVLSDRVLRILLNGVSPSKILCLTYTKAAAVEMSSRIAGRLSRWAVAGEEELRKELQSLLGGLPDDRKSCESLEASARKLFAVLLETPGGMKIQTIHSFCQEVLKRFPLEAKISPYFEVMDERSAQEAINEIKNGLLRKIEQDPDGRSAQALAFLTRNVSEFQFPNIMNSIASARNKIARMLIRYSSVENVIAAVAARLGVGEQDSEESLIGSFMAAIRGDDVRKIRDALLHGAAKDNEKAAVLSRCLEHGFLPEDYPVYKSVFLTQKGELPSKPVSKGAAAFYPDAAAAMTAEGIRIQELENRRNATRVFAATKAVLYLAEDLISSYNAYKKIHSKMDYEDLVVLTRNLLENKAVADWVLFKLDGGIDNVLIDEAQDTSPDQWAIVRAVTEDFFAGKSAAEDKRTIFAVGDRKQSIYSFQGADPKEFDKMRRYFSEKAENFSEINLDVSFRSTAAVLDAVNTVFADDEVKAGVVSAGQNVTHVPFRIGDGGRVELWPLVEPEEGENKDVWLPPVERSFGESTSARLARQIAGRIKAMVEGGEILASQNRPLRYKDFMILVQRRNSFVEELVRECKNAGVNVAGIDKIRLLEQIAVQDLVSLGKFLLLPTDDLTLAEVLKSPLCGLDDDDLFRLCYSRGKASVWTRLGDHPAYSEVYDMLCGLLNKADYVRPFELYSYVLGPLQGRKKFVERMGIEAEDGIDEFVNLTLDFEQQHVPSLQGFVEWITKDDVEIKRELEQSSADMVRIMTVHGSKGLQAPVVILPDTVRVVSAKKEGGMLWDDILFYPLSARDYESCCTKIKEEEKKAALEEYRRLLYVALTRAEDRLCLCGYRRKSRASEDSWYEICRRLLGKIGEEKQDGSIVYRTEQQIEARKKDTVQPVKLRRPEFSWLSEPAPEEDLLSKPFTPSRPDDEDDVALVSPIGPNGKSRYRRGQVIHKLLQFLPDVRQADKMEVIAGFLEKNVPELSMAEKQRISAEVLRLLEDKNFSVIFGSESKAEVPVMGVVDGRIVSAQIDRLAVEKGRVVIVDFKTNRPAADCVAEVPEVYVKQLRAYKVLLERIYKDKKVETLILWTDTARLMPIE